MYSDNWIDINWTSYKLNILEEKKGFGLSTQN